MASKKSRGINLNNYLSQFAASISHIDNLMTENLKEKEIWWRDGTRSKTRMYFDVETGNHYVLQAIPQRHTEEAYLKRAIDSVLQKYQNTAGIFVKILGYKKVGDLHLFVYKLESNKTLHHQANERETIETGFIYPFLDPASHLHTYALKHREEIEERLAELSKKSTKHRITRLDQLNAKQYAINFARYANLPADTLHEYMAKNEFLDLAKKYLTAEDLQALVQHDGYPWHVTRERLIDPGDIKIGSVAIHLGCMLGHPSVFEKLSGDKEKSIEDIIDRYCIYTNQMHKKERIKNGFYVGAAYGNLRLTLGEFFNKKEKEILRKTAKDQLSILAKTEKSAHDILIILDILWEKGK